MSNPRTTPTSALARALVVLLALLAFVAAQDRPAIAPAAGAQHGTPANNAPCLVCHGNYDAEPLATRHAREGIGCVDCHGESMAHLQDEENITPPDKMYALTDVDRQCGGCHDAHDVPARAVIRAWQRHCPQKTDPSQIACTDCHGKHRLAKRSVRWDEKTGKLLP